MQEYSILMSVYYKEKPDFLRESMLSMANQTIKSNDFVLVCDGPLTKELDSTIQEMSIIFGDCLNVYRLDKNLGLGNALNYGLKKCKNEFVARMDSDDISLPNRIEKQFNLLKKHPELSIISGTVNEFVENPNIISGVRRLPNTHEEIIKFSKSRNPFNHPAILFKKSAVHAVGGYSERFPLLEDYYLWIRMLMDGQVGANIQDPIVLMRVPTDLYLRRGGFKYAKNFLDINLWMLKKGWIGFAKIFTSVIPHMIVCILPNKLREVIYKLIHR
ncbi:MULTISPECIES: glycosyltransferase [Streptococcus]|uniref:glycosyltransferase n=1 Tax=Streptococcus TaxID=1301 RepID=UPI001EE8D7EC|nr:glycosyltransferase [Streptococcus suis]MBS8055616.1 glycosyltransferase [Streptococcus suis]HEL2570403.1 glycosyltransferase [Streptococcus suis]